MPLPGLEWVASVMISPTIRFLVLSGLRSHHYYEHFDLTAFMDFHNLQRFSVTLGSNRLINHYRTTHDVLRHGALRCIALRCISHCLRTDVVCQGPNYDRAVAVTTITTTRPMAFVLFSLAGAFACLQLASYPVRIFRGYLYELSVITLLVRVIVGLRRTSRTSLPSTTSYAYLLHTSTTKAHHSHKPVTSADRPVTSWDCAQPFIMW